MVLMLLTCCPLTAMLCMAFHISQYCQLEHFVLNSIRTLVTEQYHWLGRWFVITLQIPHLHCFEANLLHLCISIHFKPPRLYINFHIYFHLFLVYSAVCLPNLQPPQACLPLFDHLGVAPFFKPLALHFYQPHACMNSLLPQGSICTIATLAFTNIHLLPVCEIQVFIILPSPYLVQIQIQFYFGVT